MKSYSTQLIAFLAANRDNVAIIDLFDIALVNGQTLRTTSWGTNLIYSSNTYSCFKYGSWSRGTITTTATYDASPEEMELTVIQSDATQVFPNTSVPIITALTTSAFDKARVTVRTAYVLKDFNTKGAAAPVLDSTLVATEFIGDIGGNDSETPITSTKATVIVASLTYLMQDPWPRRVVQSGCTNCLFDQNCQLSPSSFVTTNSIGSGSNAFTFNLGSTLPNAGPYYDGGYITFTSGQNNGFSLTIGRQNSTTQLQMTGVLPFPILPGDTINVYPGCDKTLGTCISKFSNGSHFIAFPFTPDPVRAVTQS